MKNYYINATIHKVRAIFRSIKLKNKDLTIICNNCVGGVLYNDYNMQFRSPTINLYLSTSDYLKFCKNINFYKEQKLIQIENDRSFPVGLLYDIKIYFMHYQTFDEAKDAWYRRFNRINNDNLCFILVQGDDCKEKEIREFLSFQAKGKKILLLNHDFNLENTFYIKGFEDCNSLGNIIEYDTSKIGMRYFDQFDFISFFNKAKEK